MSGEHVFADTSGFLALMDGDDRFHAEAVTAWRGYGERGLVLWTSDYVRLETWSLIQRRLGPEAVLDFKDLILPLVTVLTVGEVMFDHAVEKWRLARRRNLSLVDITSFDCMRKNSMTEAFAFDRHFSEEGFRLPDGIDSQGSVTDAKQRPGQPMG
jgi:predicted nucleic acid-binding protein